MAEYRPGGIMLAEQIYTQHQGFAVSNMCVDDSEEIVYTTDADMAKRLYLNKHPDHDTKDLVVMSLS